MVNTFLPYIDFRKCAQVLDMKRLGKQRVEASQIINLLNDYTFLMQEYGFKYDKTKETVKSYLTKLRGHYLKQNYRYVRMTSGSQEYIKVPLDSLGTYESKNVVKLGWGLHPAVIMWFGYTTGLKYYTNCMINEWIRRGYKNTMKTYDVPLMIIYPRWLSDEKFRLSHQSNLIRKLPEHYIPIFGEHIKNDLEYIWPSNE